MIIEISQSCQEDIEAILALYDEATALQASKGMTQWPKIDRTVATSSPTVKWFTLEMQTSSSTTLKSVNISWVRTTIELHRYSKPISASRIYITPLTTMAMSMPFRMRSDFHFLSHRLPR